MPVSQRSAAERELNNPVPAPGKTHEAEVSEHSAPGGPNPEPRGLAAGQAVLPPSPLAAPAVSDIPSRARQPSESVGNRTPAIVPSGGAGIPSGSAASSSGVAVVPSEETEIASGGVGVPSAPADAPPTARSSLESRLPSSPPSADSQSSATPKPGLAEPPAVEIVGDRYSEQADIFGPPAVDRYSSPFPATDPPVAAASRAGEASGPATTGQAADPSDLRNAARAPEESGSARAQNLPESGLPVNGRPTNSLPADDVEAYQLFSDPKVPAATPAQSTGSAAPETADSQSEKPALAEPTEERLPATASPQVSASEPANTLSESVDASTEAGDQEDAESQADKDFYDLFGPAAPSGKEDPETNPIEDGQPGSDSAGDPAAGSHPIESNDLVIDQGLEWFGAEFSDGGQLPAVLTQAGGLMSATVRTWHDDTDTFQCAARLVHVNSKRVILRQASGDHLAVSIRRLGQADLKFVHQQVVALRLARARNEAAEKLAIVWAR